MPNLVERTILRHILHSCSRCYRTIREKDKDVAAIERLTLYITLNRRIRACINDLLVSPTSNHLFAGVYAGV